MVGEAGFEPTTRWLFQFAELILLTLVPMTGIEPAKLIAVIIYKLDNALALERSSALIYGGG